MTLDALDVNALIGVHNQDPGQQILAGIRHRYAAGEGVVSMDYSLQHLIQTQREMCHAQKHRNRQISSLSCGLRQVLGGLHQAFRCLNFAVKQQQVTKGKAFE